MRLTLVMVLIGAVYLTFSARLLTAAAVSSSPYTSPSSATVRVSSSTAGATGVHYVVGFRTSSLGALVQGLGSVTLIAPPGTVLPTSVVLSQTGVHLQPVLVGLDVTASGAIGTLTVPWSVKSDTELGLSFTGVTNSPTPGPQSLEISTSSDLTPTTTRFTLTGVGRPLGRVANASLQQTSVAAGASLLTWTTAFTIPQRGSLTAGVGEIFLVGPPGTDFGSTTISDKSTGKSGGGAVVTSDGGAVTAVQTQIPLNPGDRIVLTTLNVQNTASLGTQNLEIATSADPAWTDVAFTILPASQVGMFSVTATSSAAGATETNQTIRFRTSSTGGLVAHQGTITLFAPPGENFGNSGLVTDLTTGASHSFWIVLGGVTLVDGQAVLSFLTPVTIRPDDSVEIVDIAATNPGGSGTQTFSMDTSSQPIRADGSLGLSAPAAVGSTSLKISATPQSSGGGTTYSVSFRTSAGGALIADQGDIELLGPPGIVFSPNSRLTDLTTGASGSAAFVAGGSAAGPDGRWLTVRPGFAIGPLNRIVLSDLSVTQTHFAWKGGVSVVTTSDTRPAVVGLVTSGATAPGVGKLRASCSTTSAGAAGALCSFQFVTSAGGALPSASGSVTVIAPIGFELAGASTITDLTTKVTAPVPSVRFGGSSQEIATFDVPMTIRPGDAVLLSVKGVTLPAAPGGQEISLATSSDLAPATVRIVTVAPGAVRIVSSSESSVAPGATNVTYTTTIVTSASGTLAPGYGTISIVAPTGTRFAGNATVTDLRTRASALAPTGTGADNSSVISLQVAIPVRGGDQVEVVMTQVTNPTVAIGKLIFSTSSDEALESAPLIRNRWTSTIADSLRTPREAIRPTKSLPVNASIAATLALVLAFPSTLFNQTFSNNYADIIAWWERRTRWLRRYRWLRTARDRLASRRHHHSESESERRAELRTFAVVFVAGAVLGSFNDPNFDKGSASLVTLCAVALSNLASVTVPAAVALLYHRHRYHRAPRRWHALPAGLLIALACVVFSRLTRFEPGYLYGVVYAVLFTRKLGRNPAGYVAFLSTITWVVTGFVAWFAWVPVAGAAIAHPNSLPLGFLDDFLAMVFISGLVGPVFALIPVRGLAGFKIRQWNNRAWLALYFVVAFAVVQVLLRPSTRVHEASMSHAPLVGTIVAFVVAAGASLAFFEHFESKNAAESEPRSLGARLHSLLQAAQAVGIDPGDDGDDGDDEPARTAVEPDVSADEAPQPPAGVGAQLSAPPEVSETPESGRET